MSAAPLVVSPADQPPALHVLGVDVTVLATNEQTRGYEITLVEGDVDMGPPPHSHGWDESFYVLAGSVEMVLAGRARSCSAGTLVHVPAGTVHGFTFGREGGRLLEITGAGGQATRMFTRVDREIPPGPPDLAAVTRVLGMHGVTLA